jgi:hypothetical protein
MSTFFVLAVQLARVIHVSEERLREIAALDDSDDEDVAVAAVTAPTQVRTMPANSYYPFSHTRRIREVLCSRFSFFFPFCRRVRPALL